MALFRGLGFITPIKIFVSVILIVLVTIWVKSFFTYGPSEQLDEKLNSLNQVFYQLDTQRPLIFNVTDNIKSLRLGVRPFVNLSNANHLPALLHFSILIKLLDHQHHLIFERSYHVVEKTDNDISRFTTQPGFRNGEQLQPLQISVINLPLATKVASGFCEVFLLSKDSIISAAGAQMYVEVENILPYSIVWQTLHPVKRALMEDHNIYGTRYLTRAEKDNVGQRAYLNIAPQGMLHKDIHIITSTVNYNVKKPPVVPAVALEEYGFLIDQVRSLSMPLSQSSNHVRLQFFPAAHENQTMSKQGDISVKLALYRHYAIKPEEKTIVLHHLPNKTTVTLPQSLVSISANQPVFVYPQLRMNHDHYQNIIEPFKTDIYRTSDTRSIRYRLLSKNSQPIPLRVDVVALYNLPEKPQPLRYQLLDAEHHVLSQGQLALSDQPAKLHAILGIEELRLREPTSYFFLLPPSVRNIVFYGAGDAFVAVYDRPYLLPVRHRILTDFYEPIDSDKTIPSWFSIQPENEAALWREARVAQMRIQKPVPMYEDYLLNYRYFSEKLMPVHYDSGLLVLSVVRWEKNMFPHDDLYQSIMPNKKLTINFESGYQEQNIHPQLIVVPETKSGDYMAVQWNQQQFHIHATATPGRYALPSVLPKTYQVSFVTKNPVQLFLNYLLPHNPVYHLTFLCALSQTLTFKVPHSTASPQHLVAKIYHAKNTNQPIKILATISPARKPGYQPTLDYTFPVQEFILGKSEFQPAIALDSQKQLSGGEALSMVVGSDLQTGLVSIQLKTQSNTPSYVAVFRLNNQDETFLQEGVISMN